MRKTIVESHRSGPRWWQLYLLCGLLVPLFFLEASLAVTTVAHQILQVGILALIFSLIFAWLRVNSARLSREEPFHDWTPSHQSSPAEARQDVDQPLFHFPPEGLRGTLSDTFQQDWLADQPTEDAEGRHR